LTRVEIWKEVAALQATESVARVEDGCYYMMDYSQTQSYPLRQLNFKLSGTAHGESDVSIAAGYYISSVAITTLVNGDFIAKIMLKKLKKVSA
jgi:hypothetical protein